MATAGRILIIPKGEYDASAKYEMLDLVSHNGTSWLAKKTCTGIAPSNDASEYWHNMFDIAISDINKMANDVDYLNSLVVYETVKLSQTYDYMYVNPKPGYHLTSAMVTTYANGDSDIIIGICWQNDKYDLFTKTAPDTTIEKDVMLVWTRTS